MKFRKPFVDEGVRIFSDPGDPIVSEYEAQFDKEGNLVLKEVGKKDLYLEIQSHALSTDINVIMAKYAAGDTDVLNRVQGYYTDISDIPDIHGLYNMLKSAEQDFAKLSPEVKQRFDNSFEKYLFSVGDQDWFDKMQMQPVKEETLEKETTTDGE